MSIISAYKSDPGLDPKKQHNEDYIWVDEEVGLYLLADGLGGQEAGDVASKMAANTIGPMVVNGAKENKPIKGTVVQAIETANTIVYDAAHSANQKRQMGTTIAMVLIQANTAYISHAGDSRVYLLQDTKLTQLTEDDSWSTFSGTAGSRSKLDNFLTKSIGQDSKVDPSFQELTLSPGDCLFLCTDGLWDMVSAEQIVAELTKAGDNLNQAITILIDKAKDAGGLDNISLIAIKIASD